jgi:hypothetical protein
MHRFGADIPLMGQIINCCFSNKTPSMIRFPYFQALSEEFRPPGKSGIHIAKPVQQRQPVPAKHFEQGAK